MIRKLITAVSICLIALGTGTLTSQAKIVFAPIIDASLSVNSAAYNLDSNTLITDTAGNTLSSADQSTSQNAYIYFAPNFALTQWPNLWMTPSIEFEYYGANNILAIEDEAFVFATSARTYGLLGANYRLNRTWHFKLKGFGRLDLNKSANDETLATGYYTYQDLGFWSEARANHFILTLPARSKFGIKYYTRHYPNATNAELVAAYEEAGFDTTNIPKDLREKDIAVSEAWLREELTWGRLPLLTNFELHVKQVNYAEQQIVRPYDTFSGDLREDQYLDFYLELPFLVNRYHQFEIDYGVRLRTSNQNYQDTSDDLYFDNFYSYLQQRFKLLYNFKLGFKLAGFEPKGSLSYSYQQRTYPHRPSKQQLDEESSSGVYVP